MKKFFTTLAITAALGTAVHAANAAETAEFNTTVPMQDKGAATFYVPGQIAGVGDVELMVDTGSGYMTINEVALEKLKAANKARYVKELRGILANGKEMVVPVYALDSVNIGGNCWLQNVEAAVFPGKTRFILGLSALQKASPFIFSMNPANLVLSNCKGAPAEKVAQAEDPVLLKH